MSHANPVVSVCIANYNGVNLLPECLESVLAQSTHASLEIIAHDDASQDGSLQLLASRYPQVRVLASPDNVGFCIANNRMADAATGDYLLLLNNDAALGQGAIQALLSEARCTAGDAILTLPQHDWETGALVDRGCLLDPFYNPVPNLDPERSEVAYVIGACLWIPRALWIGLGGFPDWMGSIGEDMYLGCAARLGHIPVRCIRGSGYRHRQGASFGGNRAHDELRTTYRRRELSERNKTAVIFICTPGMAAWPLLLLHHVALASEAVLITLLRRTLRPWRQIYRPALGLVSRDWRALRARRQQLQRGRKISIRAYFRPFTWAPRKLLLLCRFGLPRIE